MRFLSYLCLVWLMLTRGASGHQAVLDAQEAAEFYLDQLRRIPGAVVRAKPQHQSGSGIAMVATDEIKTGEVVLDAPVNDVLMIRRRVNSSDPLHIQMQQAFAQPALEDYGCLALLVERSRGSNSPFHHMVRSGLPSKPESSLLLQDGDDEVVIYHSWHIAIAEGLYDWRKCASQLRTLRWESLLDGQKVNDIARWAVSAWQTRSFGEGLVPALSFFNHHWNHSVEKVVDQNRLTLRAMRDIRVGQQMFLSYGTFSNMMLLAQYGFTIKGNPIMEAPLSFLMLQDASDIQELLMSAPIVVRNRGRDLDDVLSGIWFFRSDYPLVVSDALLWQTRIAASKLTSEEADAFERTLWSNMTGFYSSVMSSVETKTRIASSIASTPLQLMRSDKLVCSTWKRFCSSLRRSLMNSTKEQVLRLRQRSDNYAKLLAAVATAQLKHWTSCTRAMQDMLVKIDRTIEAFKLDR
eukprot:TRINITY_DN34480_c0_g1_i1.p1 TRINITY_DN34480_c0_g1~~TRINITY_DN34480_c0_g1_i1.p1  ORF type:complete len:474 (-),score=44.20 TRINITY_DN34480_c0_g1_i1:12-1403(-)